MRSFRTPDDLKAFAVERGLTATLHSTDEPTPTVEAAAAALGIARAEMTKNVLFLVDGAPVLVVAVGESRVDERALGRHFGVGRKKVKIASPDQTFEITGYEAGCVPPFGHQQPLPTLIDEVVMQLERVYGGTGDLHVLISLPPQELVALTSATVLPMSRSDPAQGEASM